MRVRLLVLVVVLGVVVVIVVRLRLRLRQRRRRRGLQLGFLARVGRSRSSIVIASIGIGFTVSLTTIAPWFGLWLFFLRFFGIVVRVLVLLSTRPASPSRHSTTFGSIWIAHFHVDRRALFFFGNGIGGRVCRHDGVEW